jgi:hypothetical protein
MKIMTLYISTVNSHPLITTTHFETFRLLSKVNIFNINASTMQ